jgi:hypothetical protein
MSPLDLGDEFKSSRYAHSLTNIHPKNYPPEEKNRLYTKEFAEHALANGDISAPKNKTVLWSGGYIPNHPLGYGLGRIIAERWLVEKNLLVEAKGDGNYSAQDLYHTVAMTEAGLPVLNPMWDDKTVPNETKWAVTPTYIMGFARTAKGEVTLNVDDTDIDSFFRQNELVIVMNNSDITSVRVVRVNLETDKLEETLYPDRFSWYEAQKDQWVDSIITRFIASKTEPIDEALHSRMAKSLAEEIIESYKNYKGNNTILANATDEFRGKNQGYEYQRLLKFAPIINSNPELIKHEKFLNSGLTKKIDDFFSEIRVENQEELLGDKRIIEGNPHPKRLVFLQGGLELIRSNSVSDSVQAKDIIKQILPSSKTKPYGYKFIVPQFVSGVTEQDLFKALIDKEGIPKFSKAITESLFPIKKILGADNKLEFAKNMISSTTLLGYCYGTSLARKISQCLNDNLVNAGFKKEEALEALEFLKIINIAPIVDCISVNTPHTEISFLQSGDTVASLYMQAEIVASTKGKKSPFTFLMDMASEKDNIYANPNCAQITNPNSLSLYKNGNTMIIISNENAEHSVGYYSIRSNNGDKPTILDPNSISLTPHTYHPNKHGIRGYIFGNEHIPELQTITVAQNGFSEVIRPILKACLLGNTALSADIIQRDYLSEGHLRLCSLAKSTGIHLRREIEREFYVRSRT